jgi:hypothetical protein
MRKILCSIFILVSCQAIGQFNFRLYAGGSLGDIVTSGEETTANNKWFQTQTMDVYYISQERNETYCTQINKGRIGLGFKWNKNRFFAEFSPAFDLSSFTYQWQYARNNTYFYDEAHLNPVNVAQVAANGWEQTEQRSFQRTEFDVFAIGLNFNIGFQISDRHSAKLFVCDTRMPLNQFETEYSFFEIYTTRSLGLSYEFMFAKNFCVNIQPSIPIKALDEKREEYYMPIKRTPFVNIILGFQFPEKSERLRKEKYKPQIL